MATVAPTPPTGSDPADATKRRYGTTTLTIHATLGTADVLDCREFRDIAIKPPASVTAIDIYGAETAAGTFVLIDNIGTNGQMAVVASKWNVLDTAKIAPFGFLKFVSTGANGSAAIVAKT